MKEALIADLDAVGRGSGGRTATTVIVQDLHLGALPIGRADHQRAPWNGSQQVSGTIIRIPSTARAARLSLIHI